jgi:AmmeMemoRadiSam system protein B/AmmeMemoRadiSam system protein A
MRLIMKKNIFFCTVLSVFLLQSVTGCSKSKTPPSGAGQAKASVVEPVVAGQFYPGDKAQLKAVIEKYLADAKPVEIEGHIIGLAVPHAGYQYSGPVAASGFKQLQGKDYKTVVVIAPSHRVPFEGVALTTKDFYETPLGRIPIANDLSRKLISENSWAKDDPRPFLVEHSLEVELPFLQTVLNNFRLLPIIMGLEGTIDVEKLAEALNRLLPGGDALFVASTDLSHYHAYNEAVEKDKKTIKIVEGMDAAKLERSVQDGSAEMCGSLPVCTLMALTKIRGGSAKLIEYANSGDTAGDKSRVVGYAAMAFAEPEKQGLTETQKKTLLKVARQAVEAEVLGKRQTPVNVSDPLLNAPGAVFVTLKKRGDLRGCIGHIFPIEPLIMSVRDNAIAAASRDPRFEPVTPQELKDIHIEISVLTSPEPLANPLDVRVGTDGLIITKGFNKGVLLPQVPVEQGWGKEEFLDGICRKAGLQPGSWKDAKLERFQAIVFSE